MAPIPNHGEEQEFQTRRIGKYPGSFLSPSPISPCISISATIRKSVSGWIAYLKHHRAGSGSSSTVLNLMPRSWSRAALRIRPVFTPFGCAMPGEVFSRSRLFLTLYDCSRPFLDRCLGLFALQFVETFGQNADQLVMSVQGLVDVSETVTPLRHGPVSPHGQFAAECWPPWCALRPPSSPIRVVGGIFLLIREPVRLLSQKVNLPDGRRCDH